MPPAVTERSLAPELSLVDCLDDVLWQQDGRMTLVYRLQGWHEPALDDGQFDAIAFMAENVWSGLPEETSYQFYVLVDHVRGLRLVEQALPPIATDGPTSELLDEIRRARLDDLLRVETGGTGDSLVQERRHYLAATFRPSVFRDSGWRGRLRQVVHGIGRFRTASDGDPADQYDSAYQRALADAATFNKQVAVALSQMGVGFERCHNPELISFVYSLLNPTASRSLDVEALSRRARVERHEPPKSLLEEIPFAADVSPIHSLTDDDMLVRREHLRIGDRFVAVVTLKQLPDKTEPGLLVPLLRMGRTGRYVIVFRVDIPRNSVELAALRAKATLAAGLRLENFLVKSDRSDPVAKAVERQSDEALDRIIGSTQRVFGVGLSVTLHERSAQDLDAAVQETLGVMSRAYGMRGYRETYLLKPAWLSTLPGAPVLIERRRKALTPTMVDMLPCFDFRVGSGKVPFTTPNNSLVLYDPFDTAAVANANVLITGTSGAGKSVLAQFILSGYEVACAGRSEPLPYVFILDNGGSYQRYMELRPQDARYVTFTFENPPGVDIFAWNEEEGSIEEHVSRLEWLLLDLLRVSEAEEERFERKKAAIEEALFRIYKGGLAASFSGLGKALEANAEGRELVPALFPFTEGKFKRLFEPNPAFALDESVRAVVYDFKGLSEHRDLSALALRIVIYQVHRFSARVSRKRHRTFLAIDESWALLDSAVTATSPAPLFIASAVRMGRKVGMSVIGLSQVIEDFARSAYGAAILGNSATKFVGMPGGEGVDGLRRHLQLTDRQVEQVRRLARTPRYHEFLLIQGETTHVVRVPLDPLSRWIFTTSPRDRERLADLAQAEPEMPLIDRIRLLAKEG
jgi:type IV secretion system protein VirB4